MVAINVDHEDDEGPGETGPVAHERDGQSEIVAKGHTTMVNVGIERFLGVQKEFVAFGHRIEEAMRSRLRLLVDAELQQQKASYEKMRAYERK